MNKKIGLITGVFDLFHIGHLRALNSASELCDFLIVGVNSDYLVEEYKGHKVFIPQEERMEIIENIKSVDKVILLESLERANLAEINNVDIVFVGADWKGSERWNNNEANLLEKNISVMYIDYTGHTSSTEIRKIIKSSNEKMNLNKPLIR